MAKIYLCFLWHMHQPFYKDLVSGEYRLPWTRMHALKDYYGMVKILEEFPQVKQTFNLVPSMMVQVEEYASGAAKDPFLEVALKPAESLTAGERQFLLRNFFMAPDRMIHRYPRYRELQAARHGNYSAQDFRDLQVLSQLAWFDEEFQDHDPDVRALVTKGRDYNLEDQKLIGRKEKEICAAVIPEYRKLAAAGQIEISTTPFYHPILPLLCDTDIAAVSHPHVPLPPRFRHPEDAQAQLEMSRDYIGKTFGVKPVGLWPSEGSVSDHVLDLAAQVGFEWAATDNGVLDRTLRRAATPDVTYKPWRWSQLGRGMNMIFRDHLLSDLIGFVYQGMNAGDAAGDFLYRIRENCRGIVESGRDALVPIILDGENAWEYYDHNGRPFFRELYGRITADAEMEAITVSEAFRRLPADHLENIFPGSWINANFDVWIGADEDNTSWRLLLDAHKAFDDARENAAIPEEKRKLAREELFIAEGSDWNWWYGPEHSSDNRVEFDQIYREHLANVYRALGLATPAELSNPILKMAEEVKAAPPLGPIRPTINGVVDSYFEWLGAGLYQVDTRSGSMHGKRSPVHEVRYGAGDSKIFVRIDFAEQGAALEGLEITAELGDAKGDACLKVRLARGAAQVVEGTGEAAYRDVVELGLPVNTAAVKAGAMRQVRLSFWQDGLPVQSVPPQGFLEIPAEDPESWTA